MKAARSLIVAVMSLALSACVDSGRSGDDASPSPSPTPVATPSGTPTPAPSPAPTGTPTATPTPGVTPTPGPTMTPTPSPGATPTPSASPTPTPGGKAAVRVLSNRADLVSGGDALVELVFEPGATPAAARVTLNDVEVTASFALRPNGRHMGLVGGLAVGTNRLVVTVGADVSTGTIINYPNGGPIFSGPQIQPWVCQAGAVDAQCNQPPQYSYFYKSTDRSATGLRPYDPENPPSDVAQTTTDNGQTVPFIVRQELGYQARDQYKILQLYMPDQPWTPWAPQPQWNRKVLVPHGGSCGNDHAAGTAPLNDYSGTIPANPVFEQSYITALGRGFAVMSTALGNLGHNCNLVTAAEALMMAKERLVEQYGELRYTIGTGCSGGSITQQHVANAYPGLYDGLITMCAYPDALTTGAQFADLHMLRLYFENPSRWASGVVWSPTQFADVEGHITHANAVAADEAFFKSATDPASACRGVTDAQRYHPDTNPGGVRCGILDYLINVLGPRPPEVWSAQEQLVGRGFGGFFADNKGIQYGLNALRAGRITPAQFVDLNVKIGGLDIDFKPTAARLIADRPALANAYRSGGVNVTNNLDTVPIINFTGPDPGIAHDVVHAWWTRWRLEREHGHHDNHVMWGGPVPLIGDFNYVYMGLTAMDRWLAAVEADDRDIPLAQKIVANKPDDVHDQCSNGAGVVVLDDVCPELIQARYETPRVVAGDVREADTMKCVLRPFSRSDYGPVGMLFTAEQWTQLEALFADGVCDYSQPGVDSQPTIPWLSYQNPASGVVYGGAPLPPAPANSGAGLASPAFARR
jgi:hypothetical protein